MRAIIVLIAASLGSANVHAACTPDPNEQQVDCENCGNLEQNPTRGFDLARNAMLDNEPMRREIRLSGSTEVNLVNPPDSSPGVLFYRVNVTDRSWRIVDTNAYSQATVYHQELEVGWEASLRGGLASVGGFGSEVAWRQSMTREFNAAITRAVSFGSIPYIYILEDQNGREIERRDIERNAGRVTPRVPGPSDTEPDPRYREIDCVNEDPRHNGEQTSGGGGGSGGSTPPGTGGGSGGFGWPEPRQCRLVYEPHNTILICPAA